MEKLCPCGTNKRYLDCCGQYIEGSESANSPELLMRSRYSAFYLHQAEYLLRTSSQQLASTLTLNDLQESFRDGQFVGLSIEDASDNEVEFVAYFLQNDQLHTLHERSLFLKEQGHWKYHSGKQFPHPVAKMKRNDSCPCGSGKKFKKCHLRH